MFIDVDGLKVINDTYGHKEGDVTIVAVSRTIKMACGAMDVCGRIGGDEFVVVGRGENFAKIFEDRFNFELEKQNKNLNKPYELDASIGYITTTPEESDSLIDLVQQADAEMYKVKRTKKNHR
nr:GGDEF domain-containing protein [uncultured Eubacterium sp.]